MQEPGDGKKCCETHSFKQDTHLMNSSSCGYPHKTCIKSSYRQSTLDGGGALAAELYLILAADGY